ncbi:hypothetical protein ANRL4_00819 [Anaerolineae bacterium]|nr:hypothetical protein ANRL4_00819 [Anaerolineae bacterium]
MTTYDASRAKLDELRVDALYGKKQHFNAADRKQRCSMRLGIAAMMINTILCSLLFGLASSTFPEEMKWIGAALALVSTGLTGLQTFLNLQKDAEGHKRIANRFLSISKECGRLSAYYQDGVYLPEELRKQLESLAKEYDQVCMDAELFPTNKQDYWKAQRGFKSGEESYTKKELKSQGR